MPADPLTASAFQILTHTRTKVVRVGFDDTRPDVPQATLEVFTPQGVPVGITLPLEVWDMLATLLDASEYASLAGPLILLNTRVRVVRVRADALARGLTVEELRPDAPAQVLTLTLETWDLLATAIAAHRVAASPVHAHRLQRAALDALWDDLRDDLALARTPHWPRSLQGEPHGHSAV